MSQRDQAARGFRKRATSGLLVALALVPAIAPPPARAAQLRDPVAVPRLDRQAGRAERPGSCPPRRPARPSTRGRADHVYILVEDVVAVAIDRRDKRRLRDRLGRGRPGRADRPGRRLLHRSDQGESEGCLRPPHAGHCHGRQDQGRDLPASRSVTWLARPLPTSPRPSASTRRMRRPITDAARSGRRTGRGRPGHRRLRRGHPPRSRGGRRSSPRRSHVLQTSRRDAVPSRESMTRRSPTSARSSGSIRRTSFIHAFRGLRGWRRASMTGRSPTSEAIRAIPKDADSFAQRGQARRAKASSTRPSPTSPRPSGSIRIGRRSYVDRGHARFARGKYDEALADYERGHPARSPAGGRLYRARPGLGTPQGPRQGAGRLRACPLL